jgi:hypothetical protein
MFNNATRWTVKVNPVIDAIFGKLLDLPVSIMMLVSAFALVISFILLLVVNDRYRRKTWAGKKENLESLMIDLEDSVKKIKKEMENLEGSIKLWKQDPSRSRFFAREAEFDGRTENDIIKDGTAKDRKQYRQYISALNILRREKISVDYEKIKKEFDGEKEEMDETRKSIDEEKRNLTSSLVYHVKKLRLLRNIGGIFGISFIVFTIIYSIVDGEIPVITARIFGIIFMIAFTMMHNLYTMLRNLNDGAINVFEMKDDEKPQEVQEETTESSAPVDQEEEQQGPPYGVASEESQALLEKIKLTAEEKRKIVMERRKEAIFKELTNEGTRITANVARNAKVFGIIGGAHGIIFGIFTVDPTLSVDIISLFIISQFISFYMFNVYINMEVFRELLSTSFNSFLKSRLDKFNTKPDISSYKEMRKQNNERFKTLKYTVMLMNYYSKEMTSTEISNKSEVMKNVINQYLLKGKRKIERFSWMLQVIPSQDIIYCYNIAGAKNQFKESGLSKFLKRIIPIGSVAWTVWQIINLLIRSSGGG